MDEINKLVNPYSPDDSAYDTIQKNKDNIINMDAGDDRQIDINKENIETIQKEVNIEKKDILNNKKDILNNKKNIDINKDSSNTNKNKINVNQFNIDKNKKNIDKNTKNIDKNTKDIDKNTKDIKKLGTLKIDEIIAPIQFPKTIEFEVGNGFIITQYALSYPNTFFPRGTWIINTRTIKEGKTLRLTGMNNQSMWDQICQLEFKGNNKCLLRPLQFQFYFGVSKIK